MLLHKCCVKRAGPHVKSAPIWLHERTMAPEPQAQAVPKVAADRMPVNVRHFALRRQSGMAGPGQTALRHSMGRVPPWIVQISSAWCRSLHNAVRQSCLHVIFINQPTDHHSHHYM